MKKHWSGIFGVSCTLILCTIGSHAQTLTMADPNYGPLSELATSIGWYQLPGTNAWSASDGSVRGPQGTACLATLNQLKAAGVPDTRSIEIQWDGPEFKRGVHTLAEIRTSCQHLDRIGQIKRFEFWAIQAMNEAALVQKARTNNEVFRQCIQTYNQITKAGVPPSERVPDQVIQGKQWSGTIEELRQKWCDSGMATAASNTAKSDAPFRAALKGDKLKWALRERGAFLPGGGSTADPHQMLLAPVWFSQIVGPKTCADGRDVYTLTRLQFGSDQQLLSQSSHEYCGRPPASAYR